MKELHLFVGLSAANHLAYTGARLAVILYAVHLQLSPAIIGLLSAMFGLLPCFASVAVGRLMDRIGPRRPMIGLSILMAAGGAAGLVPALAGGGFWTHIVALGILSTLVGSCYSFFFLGHTQWIGRIGQPGERLRNINLASVGLSVAAFLGPLAVGLLIDHGGYAAAFATVALVPLIPAALIGLNVVRAPSVQARPAGSAERKEGVAGLVREPEVARIFGVSVLAYATFSIVHFLVPVYCVQIGLSASTIGLVMAGYAVASIVVRAFMTPLSGRFTSWQLMLASITVSGVCLAVFPLLTAVAALVALSFMMGLGTGLAGPLSQALLYDAAPPERVGELMGLRVSALNMNQTFVPVAAGAAGAAVGVAPVFWVMAFVLFWGAFVTRAQWRRPRA